MRKICEKSSNQPCIEHEKPVKPNQTWNNNTIKKTTIKPILDLKPTFQI